MYLDDSPKILKMRIHTGKSDMPLFYSYEGDPQAYAIPEKKWIDKPSFLDHMPERELTPDDIPDLMLHGVMDDDSFQKLDGTGLISPVLKEMYGKIQDLNRKLADLEAMTDANGHMHNPKEMQMGLEVEKEHTDDPHVAAQIADDHLEEMPNYYTKLKQMESEGKAEMAPDQISDALMRVIDAVKSAGSGSDALKSIFETVGNQCADHKRILKIVGEAFGL